MIQLGYIFGDDFLPLQAIDIPDEADRSTVYARLDDDSIVLATQDVYLEYYRQLAHLKRRARRTQAELAGFTHSVGEDSYRIDSDRDSILRISNATNAALTAIITQSAWSTEWKCADNSKLLVDAAGMLAIQISLAAHGQACHTRSEELDTAINSAGALAALAAIDINDGWPE